MKRLNAKEILALATLDLKPLSVDAVSAIVKLLSNYVTMAVADLKSDIKDTP